MEEQVTPPLCYHNSGIKAYVTDPTAAQSKEAAAELKNITKTRL